MEIIPFIQRVVGIATTLGFLVVAVLSGILLFEKPKGSMYVIHFEESVDGLSKGASVTYNGIEVGYVKSIIPVSQGEDAGTNAVVIVIKKEFLEADGGNVRIFGEPDEYHPYVVWVDRGVPLRDRILFKHDWIVAVADAEGEGRVDVETVLQLDSAIQRESSRGERSSDGTLFHLVVRRAAGGEEELVPVQRRELGVSFSEGGTRASMAQNLVTGIKNIDLAGGHPSLSALKGIESSESVGLEAFDGARIATMETGINRLFRIFEQKLPSILQNVDVVAANLNELTGRLNKEADTVHEVLTNVRDLTDPEHEMGALVRDAAASFESAAASLATLEADMAPEGRISRSIDHLERLLSEEGDIAAALASVRELLADGGEIPSVLEDASQTLDSIEATARELEKSMAGTGRVGGTLDDLRYSVRHDLRPMLLQLGETLQVLQDTMARFNANPNPVISGRAEPQGGSGR